MQNIVEQALTTYKHILPLWLLLRYYHGSTCTKNEMKNSAKTLINKMLTSTSPIRSKKTEIHFLDWLVKCNNNLSAYVPLFTENQHTRAETTIEPNVLQFHNTQSDHYTNLDEASTYYTVPVVWDSTDSLEKYFEKQRF